MGNQSFWVSGEVWLQTEWYDRLYSSGHRYSVIIMVFAHTFTCGFDFEIWQLLASKMAISKVSGNTVKIKKSHLALSHNFNVCFKKLIKINTKFGLIIQFCVI